MTQCPRCNGPGRSVTAVTLMHNTLPGVLGEADDDLEWYVCASGPECDVVYFHDRRFVSVQQVRAIPFHKSAGAIRTVCFCFGHTEKDIIDDVHRSGVSSIQASVREACRRGEDDCERLNPHGRCCLDDIARVLGSSERRTS